MDVKDYNAIRARSSTEELNHSGLSPSVEIAIAFPSPSFFPLLPNQIVLFQLLKLVSFVCNGKVIIFRFGFL